MKLENHIVKANFENNWLAFLNTEELILVPKDPIFVRWLKFFVQALFCWYSDVYAHIRINRVTLGIWKYFTYETVQGFSCKQKYISLVKNLLDCDLNNRHPITSYRKDLLSLVKKISQYGLEKINVTGKQFLNN